MHFALKPIFASGVCGALLAAQDLVFRKVVEEPRESAYVALQYTHLSGVLSPAERCTIEVPVVTDALLYPVATVLLGVACLLAAAALPISLTELASVLAACIAYNLLRILLQPPSLPPSDLFESTLAELELLVTPKHVREALRTNPLSRQPPAPAGTD